MVCHIQDKNDKKLKKQNCYKNTKKRMKKQWKVKNKGWKTFLVLGFFLILVSQNNNSAFNRGFYLMQAVKCSLRLSGDSYDQKYIFVKYFQRQFNIRQGKFSINNLVAFQTKWFPNRISWPNVLPAQCKNNW